ncbi:hypothetical protein [Halomarina rubra]|uniref:Uncharacterized protein n=1 Tax=Halomarina rubra TaxID=2071873 RepID=A0ABD6ARN1_9EURY|nr:hypothetical protein [Halomarina rubra]
MVSLTPTLQQFVAAVLVLLTSHNATVLARTELLSVLAFVAFSVSSVVVVLQALGAAVAGGRRLTTATRVEE